MKPAWYKLHKHFGDEFFHSDGTLNREKLGQLVFTDSAQRKILDSITHPEIQKSIIWLLVRYFLRGTVMSEWLISWMIAQIIVCIYLYIFGYLPYNGSNTITIMKVRNNYTLKYFIICDSQQLQKLWKWGTVDARRGGEIWGGDLLPPNLCRSGISAAENLKSIKCKCKGVQFCIILVYFLGKNMHFRTVMEMFTVHTITHCQRNRPTKMKFYCCPHWCKAPTISVSPC